MPTTATTRAARRDSPARRQRIAAVLTALAAGSAFGGCGSAADKLEFAYTPIAELGFIDQVLAIGNTASSGLAPTLRITPLDAKGDPIPGVTVRTVFGSDRGKLVIPPAIADSDVLRFSGERRYDVEDVKVEVDSVDEVETTGWDAEPVVQRLDRRGRKVDNSATFSSVTITNPNDEPVPVRVVLLEYDAPPPGEPQQVIRQTSLTGLIRLGARDRTTVKLPRALRERVVGSVKAYFSR